MRLTQIIEALLFASDAPLTADDLARIDERLDEDTVTAVIDELRAEYDLGERSFQVYDVAGGYQILTRPEFVALLEQYATVPQSARLSTPALEVLAIIAYRQPLGRVEIEEIRGVQSAAVLRTLQDRGLIDAVGRSEGLGRPLLYGTTPRFLEHFGFRSLEDLPRPDELPVILRSRPVGVEAGQAASAADATAEPPGGEAGAAEAAPDGPTAAATNDAGASSGAVEERETSAQAAAPASEAAEREDAGHAADGTTPEATSEQKASADAPDPGDRDRDASTGRGPETRGGAASEAGDERSGTNGEERESLARVRDG